ncbi:MAG: hypothetical protein J6B06_01350 [Lachnospiraceae bacterium]|nr:hypothetical protein [Lachnospiraceae bacterium]
MRKTVVKKLAVLGAVVGMLSAGMIVAHAETRVMENGTYFDAEYYARTNQDVVAVYGNEESELFRHYEEFGKNENRQPVELPDKSVFDAEYYAALYQDVVAVYGTNSNSLYQHYLRYGKQEGRFASPTAVGAPKLEEYTNVAMTTEELSTESGYPAEVLRLMNEERAKKGWSPLRYDAKLEAVAMARAEEILVSFSNIRPNGEAYWSALKEMGVKYSMPCEVISHGQATPEKVVNKWKQQYDEDTRFEQFERLGVGYADQQSLEGGLKGRHWVLLFIY